MASNIKNFSAAKKDGVIALNWLATNAQTVKEFIIEMSNDGKTFAAIAQLTGNRRDNDLYTYEYIPGNTTKNVYFRIKQTDDKGKSQYSAIRIISMNTKAPMSISTYPNPATDGVTINFDRIISGSYQAELVNMAGQVICNIQSKVVNSNVLPLVWGKKPNSGLYLVRVTNKATSEQQVARLTIQ